MDLSFDQLKQLRVRAQEMFVEFPAASFTISRICDVYLDEYEDHGVPIERDWDLQSLGAYFEAVFEHPSDLTRLDELVRHASRVWRPVKTGR